MISKSHSPLTLPRLLRGLRTRAVMYSQGIASLVPKIVYGNSAGLTQNLGAQRQLARLRAKYQDTRALVDREPYRDQAAFLQENGYVHVNASNDSALLTRVRLRVSDHLNDAARCVVVTGGATRFIPEPLAAIPELTRLLTDDVRQLILAYYGCALRIESVRVWRNYHVPSVDQNTDDRFSNTFHHDNCPVTGLRVFVLLNDGVTRETGAFRFHDRRTSERLIRSMGYFHRNALPKWVRRRLIDPRTLRYFEGNTGDTCICNTQQCLHGASVPGPGTHRDILQFEIYPAEGPLLGEDALFSNLPRDAEVLALRAN
jgi:hypothetical protein